MADRVDDFDFTFVPEPPRRHVYPLDEWFDGSIWRVWAGEDFEGSPRHMQCRLHYHARQRGGWLQSRSIDEGRRRGLVFRFCRRHPLDTAGTW